MRNLKWIAPAMLFVWILSGYAVPAANAFTSNDNTAYCLVKSDCDKCGEKDGKADCCKTGSKKKAKKNCCKSSDAKGCCSGSKEAHSGCGGHSKSDTAAPAEKNPAPVEK
jgi:hypothetical protein